MNFVLVVFFAAGYVFGTAHDTLSPKDFVHQKPLKLRQILMLLHRGSAAITFHVFFEAPVVLEGCGRNFGKVRLGIDTSHLAIHFVETGILTLATSTYQTRRRAGLQTETQVLESTSVDADADIWHFLLLTPSNCFLVIIVTVNVDCFQRSYLL